MTDCYSVSNLKLLRLPFSFRGRRRSLLRAISTAPSFGGGPRTGAALKYVKQTLFSGRSRKKKVLFVITHDRSYDNVAVPAATLRRAGVQIIAIGAGKAPSTMQLRQMAGKKTGAMFTSSFRTLLSIAKIVEQKACAGEIRTCEKTLLDSLAGYYFAKSRIKYLTASNFSKVTHIIVLLSFTRFIYSNCIESDDELTAFKHLNCI